MNLEAPRDVIGYGALLGFGALAVAGRLDAASMMHSVKRQIQAYDVQESGGEDYVHPRPNYLDHVVEGPIGVFTAGFNIMEPPVAMVVGLFVSKINDIAPNIQGSWAGSVGAAAAIAGCELAAAQSTSAVRGLAADFLDRIDAANTPMD